MSAISHKEFINCSYCRNKCNLCVHKDEQIDIGDSWENESIVVDVCSHEFEDCDYFETSYNYCPICSEKLFNDIPNTVVKK